MIIPCSAGTYSSYIDPYGNIYPCTQWNFKLGNLKESSFKKIWWSKKAEEVRIKARGRAISRAVDVEELLKNRYIDFKSIPVPDDIFKSCGVAILVNDYQNLITMFKNENIQFEVFEYKEGKPIKIFGNIEYSE